jgi:hypothetical protein
MTRLLSVNVGLPRDIEWKGRTVHTGIWKEPVRGRCRVGRLNLDEMVKVILPGMAESSEPSSFTKSNPIAIGSSS